MNENGDLKIMKNNYKNWDGRLFLSNQILFEFETDKFDKLTFQFDVFNYELAIEWIKLFYYDSKNKPLNAKINHRDLSIDDCGFIEPSTMVLNHSMGKCMTLDKIDSVMLTGKKINNMMSSNITIDLNSQIIRKYTPEIIPIIEKWNIEHQDNQLESPYTQEQQTAWDTGYLYLGILDKIHVNNNQNEFFDITTVNIKYLTAINFDMRQEWI